MSPFIPSHIFLASLSMSNNSEPVMFKCQTDIQIKVAEGSCLAKQRIEVAGMPVKSRSSNSWPNLWPHRAGKTGKNANERKHNQYYGCGCFGFILSSWTLLSPVLIFQALIRSWWRSSAMRLQVKDWHSIS